MQSKIYAMIPARAGSQRLKLKNLAILNGKPLIYYAVKSAKKSSIFEKVFINSEDNIFKKIARRYEVDFYKRKKKLASSKTKSDDVIYDFFQNHPKADILVWVNSIAPFQTGNEIKKITRFFLKKKIDSLITVENKKVHCQYNNKPLNYSKKTQFSRTQDLKPIQIFVYSLMMWRRKAFLNQFKKNKSAILCGKTFFYPVKNPSTIIIKTIDDLKFANFFINTQLRKFVLKYDKIAKNRS